MNSKTVYIGADHNGFDMNKKLIAYLRKSGYTVHDTEADVLDPVDDYPTVAARVVNAMLGSKDPSIRGILICGSGQGICIAANRYKGIRACLGYDRESVRASRNDDDVNILCLPSRTLTQDVANNLAEVFLNTPFAEAARFKRRIHEIDNI
ncbi:MAG: RpiB/LacA/LacB family sugar-phosphate isomerase [Candidatus Saccharimonadales bacterium]